MHYGNKDLLLPWFRSGINNCQNYSEHFRDSKKREQYALENQRFYRTETHFIEAINSNKEYLKSKSSQKI